MKPYFVDSCIYLNLWKKEKRFWKTALDFFKKCEEGSNQILFSGFILREIKFILGNKEYLKKRDLFKLPLFKRVTLNTQDMSQARSIEREHNFRISFYDCLHLVSAKKTSSILITRDRLLLRIATKHRCDARTPENAFTMN